MSGFFGFFKKSKDQPSTLSIGPSKKAEPGPFKYFIVLTGKTLNSHNDLMNRLKRQVPDLQVVQTEAECDIILVFCPVVRGPEHDIKAALEKINEISGIKPAVLVVLHHTFDPESVVSDSSRAVSRENTLTVNCLFHEDRGLLQCRKNDESLTRIVTHIKHQTQRIKSVWERREIDQYCVPTVHTDSHSLIPKEKSIEQRLETGQSQWLSRSPGGGPGAYPRRLGVQGGMPIHHKPDVENFEPMKTQEKGGASQCGYKLENMTSKTTLEIQLQEKDRQLQEMRTEIKKLKTELAEKNAELKKKDSLLHLSGKRS